MKNIIQNKLKMIITVCVIVIAILILIGGIRGKAGNPIGYQNVNDTTLGGPFELSNSTARYALVESIVKNHSLYLNQDLAKFSAPDVVLYKGKFLSIFTPGVSLLAVPFYILGNKFGLPQLFTYLFTTIIAFANVFLIAKLSQKLGASKSASLISGFIFLFATNAFAFAFGLTQHHLSVFLIVSSLIFAAGEKNWKNYTLFGIALGLATMIDIPNLIMLAPVGIYMLVKSFRIEVDSKKVSKLRINLKAVGVIIGIVPMILIFGWYNKNTAGSFIKLAQNIGRTEIFSTSAGRNAFLTSDDLQKEAESTLPPTFSLPFQTRHQLNGFYILLFSDERSWLYYSPVVLLALIGFIFALKRESKDITIVVISIILLDILLYSMFGDPYGGWSFGARYLIPGVALMSAGVGVFLTYNKSKIMYVIFVLLLGYSIVVNGLGALTTNAVPPKVEAVNLSKPIPYTYKYNWQLINSGQETSLIYNLALSKKFSGLVYFYVYASMSVLLFVFLNTLYFIEKRKEKNV